MSSSVLIAGVSLPSSITIISRLSLLSDKLRMLSIHERSIVGSVLNVGMMKLTNGVLSYFRKSCELGIVMILWNKYKKKSLCGQE